ncbi:MAG TPA: globin [Capsulimonadaceae bacterium]|jgi:hemoglobin
MADETDIWAAVGGDEPFYRLVDTFYERVEADPPLRALYPPDLATGKNHLAWFLIQRFGGPEHFNQKRGAPRLRMRHVHFKIDLQMRNAWMSAMMDAVESLPVFAPHVETMRAYFDHSATFLINHEEPDAGQSRLNVV